MIIGADDQQIGADIGEPILDHDPCIDSSGRQALQPDACAVASEGRYNLFT
jgi:hypothetical protein